MTPSESPIGPHGWSGELVARRLSGYLASLASVKVQVRVRVRIGRDGLSAIAVDVADICMVRAHLAAAAFASYGYDGDTWADLDLKRTMEAIKIARPGDPVSLTLDPSTGTLQLRAGACVRTMRLHPLDSPERKEPHIDRSIQAEGRVSVAELTAAVRSAESVSDSVSLIVVDDGYVLGTVGYSEGEENITTALATEVCGAWGTARSVYPRQEVRAIVRCLKGCKHVTIGTGMSSPLRVEADMPWGSVRYLLGCRIEEDDEPTPETAEMEQAEEPHIPEDVEVESVGASACTALETSRFSGPTPQISGSGADCALCHGTYVLDTRRRSYPCPTCVPDIARPPEQIASTTTWAQDLTRHAVLAMGRDAS